MNLDVLKSVLRTCPICDGTIGEILHTQEFALPEGYPLTTIYDVVYCIRCGFIYADTPTSQRNYEDFYARFSKYTDSKTSTGGGGTEWDAGRLKETASLIAKMIPDKHARIADVGCVNGGMLRALHDLGYTNLCGIDPATSCVKETAKVPGVEAYAGTLSNIPIEVGQVDCLILSHVLEHVKDLRPALKYLRKFLKPNGCLYVEVPDAKRYADCPFGPWQDFNVEHINHYSLISMANLLRQCGFTPMVSGVKTIGRASDMPYPALFMAATLSTGASVPSMEKDETLKPYIIDYIAISRRFMEEIEAYVQRSLIQTSKVLMWGTGQCTTNLLTRHSLGDAEVVAFVDTNPINQGMLLQGVSVLAPDQVQPSSTPIIVASILHHRAICESIRKLGLPNPVIALRPRGV